MLRANLSESVTYLGTNALAYRTKSLITKVKSFMARVQTTQSRGFFKSRSH